MPTPCPPTSTLLTPTPTPIGLLPASGLSGLPELAALYRAETRISPRDHWQPQGTETREFVLWGIEWLLRRDLATAEVEDRTFHVTAKDLPDAAPYSRYVPTGNTS